MMVWFATIGSLGAIEIARAPEVLLAFNPWYGAQVFVHNRMAGFLFLGAVVLAITGAEALYADMGHFGRRPIRLAWFLVPLPALLLNYLGQGAPVLRAPGAFANPSWRAASGNGRSGPPPRWPERSSSSTSPSRRRTSPRSARAAGYLWPSPRVSFCS